MSDRHALTAAPVTEPSEPAGTTRLTVNIPPDIKRALDQVVNREQVTTTAALCRLVAMGEVLDKIIQRGDAVWVGKGDKLERFRFVH